jgi:hypothetical protein
MGLRPISYSIGWIMSNYTRFFAVAVFFLVLVVPTGVMKGTEVNDKALTTSETIISFLMYGFA